MRDPFRTDINDVSLQHLVLLAGALKNSQDQQVRETINMWEQVEEAASSMTDLRAVDQAARLERALQQYVNMSHLQKACVKSATARHG